MVARGEKSSQFSVVSFKFRRKRRGTVTQRTQRKEHRGHREKKESKRERRAAPIRSLGQAAVRRDGGRVLERGIWSDEEIGERDDLG